MPRRAAVALGVVIACAHASAAPTAAPLSGPTLRQLVGQKLVFGYAGSRVPAGLVARVRRGEAAGVILFSRNIVSRSQLRATVRRLQRIPLPPGLGAPLLVMVDQEGGLVKRLPGAPSRSPAELGRIGSASLARREGRLTARNLRDVGVNVNLAPVVDVGRAGSYQQRTGRSYSSDARVVSSLGAAFVRGLQDRGVAATLKHFPGLGTVAQDEDLVAQRAPLSLATLRSVDEAPFAAGLANGARLVMTGTAIYPALSRRPALLSPRVVGGELRRRLHFDGVAITDDLTTRGLARFGRPGHLGLLAAQAGNDLLLYAGDYARDAAYAEQLVDAARSGRLSHVALRASVARVLALRGWLAGR